MYTYVPSTKLCVKNFQFIFDTSPDAQWLWEFLVYLHGLKSHLALPVKSVYFVCATKTKRWLLIMLKNKIDRGTIILLPLVLTHESILRLQLCPSFYLLHIFLRERFTTPLVCVSHLEKYFCYALYGYMHQLLGSSLWLPSILWNQVIQLLLYYSTKTPNWPLTSLCFVISLQFCR
jgi:hypothetical protein